MNRFLHRDERGRFITEQQSLAMDLRYFITEWKRWAKDAIRKNDLAEARRCVDEMKDCQQKLHALLA